MPTFFIHLENALKRANEFIEVGNKPRALELLCDVLHSKKHRTWQKKHEEIMSKYLELCVELKQSYVAKEGIYQYKIICQQSYVSSFEEAIRNYISMAEQKTEEAKELSQANIEDIDDLENAQTPEDILLSAVSTEGSQDRKDRVVLIPWVKFLWESYRQCLDLLRHNARTEVLYHEIARKAFDFCIKFNRKSEFRKLCDILHLHLDQLKRQQGQNQNQNQQNTINLSDPDTQTFHLETRLLQLDFAIQMELWQEAYKATDDIKKFNLMGSGKKGLGKPSLIASYYQKLALVFWKASSPLFHAAALFRHFHLNKDLRKNLKLEEAQKLATRLVVATLSIPIPAIRPEIDKLVDTEENVIDQHHRNLSILLGISTKPPTRSSLIKDLKRMGVLQHAAAPVQDLYNLLEHEFNPLGVCGRVQKNIEFLEKAVTEETQHPEVLQYVPAIKEITIIRLIREVSQVYRTIEFNRLSELCPFVSCVELEKLMVESARRHDLQVRIDHRRSCFVFGNELRVTAGEEYTEGPYLQSMPNEQMRRQLVSMYSSLQKAVNLIEPSALGKKREDMKRAIMKTYFQNANDDHNKILKRQELIEERKDEISRRGAEREENERKRAEEQAAKAREAEEARLLEETKLREKLRREKEENDLRKQMNMDQLLRMKQVIPDLKLDDLDDEELAKLKPQDVQRKRVEQLEKERKEALAKQRKVERKVDHFERAKRLEEIPLLKAAYEEFQIKDRQVWDEFQKTRVETIQQERELAIKERERFRRLMDDKSSFTEIVMQTRQNEYQERLQEFETIVEEEREKRLEARRQKRIEERRGRFLKEKEAKRLALQEEIQRKREAEIEERRTREAEERLRLRQETETKQSSEPSSWRRNDVSAPPSTRDLPMRNRFNDVPPPPTSGRGPAPMAASGESNWRSAPKKDFGDEPKPYGGRSSDNREPPRYGGRDSGPREFSRDGPPPQRAERSDPWRRDGPPPQRREEPRDGPPPQRREEPRDGPPPQRREEFRDDRRDDRRDQRRDEPREERSWRTDRAPQPNAGAPPPSNQDKMQDSEQDDEWTKIDRRAPRTDRPAPPPQSSARFGDRGDNRRFAGRDSDRRDREFRGGAPTEPPPMPRGPHTRR